MKKLFLDIVTRKKDRYYDYLILELRNNYEINKVNNYLKELNIDLFFIIDNSYKKNIYIQYSSSKKENIKILLRKIHNFWRIKLNNDIGYKKSSKHSTYFEGKNLILKNINSIKLLDKTNLNLKRFSAILKINNQYFKLNIDPSFMGLTKENREKISL